jgi:hypothetical protein
MFDDVHAFHHGRLHANAARNLAQRRPPMLDRLRSLGAVLKDMLKPPQVRRSTPTWTACLAIIFLGFWQADLASASSPAIKYLQSVLSAHAEKLSDERLPNEPEQQHPTDPARPLRVPQLPTDLAMLKARGALVYHSAAPARRNGV